MPADGTQNHTAIKSRYLVAAGGNIIIEAREPTGEQVTPRSLTFSLDEAQTCYQALTYNIIKQQLGGRSNDPARLIDALQLADATHEARAWQLEAKSHQTAASRMLA